LRLRLSVLIFFDLRLKMFLRRSFEYYNTKLKEYKVNYRDDTSDFLSPDDFDGVEVILEPL